MIYSSGIVTVLSNREKPVIKWIRKVNTVSLEVIGKLPMDEEKDRLVRLRCKYRAIFPESFECRSLEDYTGKIKPFLQRAIQNRIIAVEVHHLNYTSKRQIDL